MDFDSEDESDGFWSSSEGSSDTSEDSSSYEDFLHRLAQNDPRETKVDFVSRNLYLVSLDNERILEAGRNLQGNTSVTELALPLTYLRDSDEEEVEALTPMLRFIEQSPVMNTIRFDVEDANRSIIDRFFTATQRSGSHIQELKLTSLQTPQFEAFSSLLRELRFLKRLTLKRGDLEDTTESAEMFAAAIGNAPTLESFRCDYDIENPEPLVERLPPYLRDLVFYWVNLGDSTEASERLAAAIGNKLFLESFSCVEPYSERPRPLDPLVERLHVHPHLKKLFLGGMRLEFFGNALRYLQQLPPMLTTLTLYSFEFSGDSFRPIYQGLCTSSSVTELCVCACAFDDAATVLFTEMLQPTKGTGCAIRSLHLDVEGDLDFHTDGNHFSRPIGQILGSVFASCSIQSTSNQLEVIECVDSLVQEDGRFMHMGREAMIRELGANAPSITLQSLSLLEVTREELQLLVVCLPKLIHLKELKLQCHHSANTVEAKRELLSGLRRNGNLARVHVLRQRQYKLDRPFFTEGESNRVETYCCRNKALPAVIAKPRFDSAGSAVNDDDKRTPIALYPRLFHQALQCPATGFGWSFAGLLAVDDGFGPVLQDAVHNRDLKRPALLDFEEEGPDRKQSRE